MAQQFPIDQLPQIATEVRKGIIESLFAAGSGHPGGALGLTEVLVSLYFGEMNIDPENPDKESRDRFVLSPAHMVPGLYSTLANRGFFPVEELLTLRKYGSRLQGHTYRDLDIGVETTGGSLGQGLSIANGFALASRMREKENKDLPSFHTYCVISDGELNEGSTWEGFMFAVKENLDNLTIILDKNGIQLSDNTENVMPLGSIRDKLEAFDLHVLEVDGHSFPEIKFALSKAKITKGKPTVIISNSIAGKGVSYMEGKWEWHGKAPNQEQYNQAMSELNNT